VPIGGALVVRHVFVLTLGFCRRSFYSIYRGETLAEFLDAHERAFEYFGGHTHEHLYDRRARCACRVGTVTIAGMRRSRRFADFWGFRPARVSAVSAAHQGQGRVRREVLAAEVFCRAAVSAMTRT